ncbi:hypothetical protein VTJ04DRAFT_6006 [Mycothermus thermophilus]|uniref:uncharacterized protein n=1 Tax=Humicola insolens TaxID=85995 RepID=UPI0037421EEC
MPCRQPHKNHHSLLHPAPSRPKPTPTRQNPMLCRHIICHNHLNPCPSMKTSTRRSIKRAHHQTSFPIVINQSTTPYRHCRVQQRYSTNPRGMTSLEKQIRK